MGKLAPCIVEELSHTAEIGLRMWAPTLADLYACAAVAMCDLVDAQPDTHGPAQGRSVAVAAPDWESLLVDWLNELLYLQEFQSMEHFKQELVEYLDYYNNRRIKAKLKGLPPAIHRQQALSAA